MKSGGRYAVKVSMTVVAAVHFGRAGGGHVPEKAAIGTHVRRRLLQACSSAGHFANLHQLAELDSADFSFRDSKYRPAIFRRTFGDSAALGSAIFHRTSRDSH